ncbi:hypothetical protein POM88_012362 [Heracleum sosnowskyi]|uniref:PGG domain-containing protein n=1 Tax=Heracleum sosnowskyi TaxID=360622 RepID=A0AAD8IXB2_9APIA|nr:hypothetical protein POM88_012362 [Heracleum sosnowskyi]
MSAEEIYVALIREDWEKVKFLCHQHDDGPFVNISRNKDSVLQKALYAGEAKLVLELLEDAYKRFKESRVFLDKLLRDVNTMGNTTLHVAATQDSCISAAVQIYEYANHLIFSPNNKGEFPIFSAVRYGQLNMFKFLHTKITKIVPDEEERNLFIYKVSNEHETYTILHVAIYNEHFELALYIARTSPGLISETDHQQMTGLHMLSMNSSAFRIRYWKWLKLLLPSPFRHIPANLTPQSATDHELEDATDHKAEDAGGTSNAIMPPQNDTNHKLKDEIMKIASSITMTIPYWRKIKKEHRRYKAARKLGSILVKNDTEWIDKLERSDVSDAYDHSEENNSGSPSAENLDKADQESVKRPKPQIQAAKYDENLNSDADEESEDPPTPLILATKYGCVDIALEIIKEHPQTVEQVDHKHGSILHLAIKYRRIKIFDCVEKSKMQMRRLNGTDATSTDKPDDKPAAPWDAEELNNESRSPAFILQDDLLLFERVEDIMKTHFHTIPNKDLETPDQLFAAKKEPLREDAQEWMKRTAENCSIVAVLIATVAFAAAYTVPGGTDDKNGSPLLLKETFFVVFTIADVLSLASTLTAVVVFLSILCSSYRLEDFKETLPKSLMFGISCLIFSLTMMMFAFAATIILMIKNRQQWTKIALYAVAFLPVTVLVATYLPFYVPLMRTFHYTVNKAKSILPTFACLKKEKLFPVILGRKPSLSTIEKPTTVLDPSVQV